MFLFSPLMLSKPCKSGISFDTYTTFVRFFSTIEFLMLSKTGSLSKDFTTLTTFLSFLLYMILLCLQVVNVWNIWWILLAGEEVKVFFFVGLS